jgi:DNA-binding NtrC family response regulator
MSSIVYVVESDPDERRWLDTALAGIGDERSFLDDGADLLERLPLHAGDYLVCSADAGDDATLHLVRELRRRGERVPVVVMGPVTAFRAAVDIARLDATDFLERPVSIGRLRHALRRLGCSAA